MSPDSDLKKVVKIALVIAVAILMAVLAAPMPRFNAALSTVVEARDGSLLGARIADDGQWRFPPGDEVPEKFRKALLSFEDRYFYFHPGINPVAIFRALKDNMRTGEIVSGGSTITMQVARLSGGNSRRTYGKKILEILQALKMELFRSKKAILKTYAANAPFGGNIVGLDAATWRYAGKSPADITWAEAAALAVLPNSPSLVYPGKNQEILERKRNELLKKLYQRKYIDSLTLVLSMDEPLPGEPKLLPSASPHLTDFYYSSRRGERIRTTIDPAMQERTAAIINNHQKELSGNMIFNAAALIVDVPTGEVLAYAGNSTNEGLGQHGGSVDIIRSLRSTGSILKPLLYAGMQESGELLPTSLVPDIPTRFPGFTPKNFDESYSGAVPADEALSQSLNIPAVSMLRKYTPGRFLELLRLTGFTSFRLPADHYGLSLILGGGETSLWELAGVYASLSRVLGRYSKERKYLTGDYHPPVLLCEEADRKPVKEDENPPLSAASIWLTYEALRKVNRPESEAGWQYFASTPGLAWKTGTSFGFRDAWAVGATPSYVIVVWAGNADGEGRPGLTGVSAAAPIMFDLAGMMRQGEWFSPPWESLTAIEICRESGFRAGPDCPDKLEIFAHINGLRAETCPWHTMVHLDSTRSKQVNAGCFPASEIISEPWFVLPPAMEYFYRQKHPAYKPLPPFAPGCAPDRTRPEMEFIYPTNGIRIFIPRDHTGEMTTVIAEAVHRNPSGKLFWHLDDKYITSTKFIHQTEILASPGNHRLTIVDESGNMAATSFTIISGR